MQDQWGPARQDIETRPLRRPPKPIGDPDRIKEVLQVGKTYRVVAKAGFDARVEDKDWDIKQVTNLAYVMEMHVTRKIESNDGHRIVELRTFDHLRNAKVLFQVEGVTIELGPLGALVLGAIDSVQPGTIETVATVKPFVETFLKSSAQALADGQASKAFAGVDSLSGKTVRIAFVDDGRGVESITPIGCQLTADEADLVWNTAVLSDCYLLPDVKVKAGETWKVDGRQLGGFLDPTLRGVPSGEIEVSAPVTKTETGSTLQSFR